MRHAYSLALLLASFLFGLTATRTAEAQVYRRENYRDIRWLGRGNTGIAIINDGTALFYNPGGLGLSNAYNFSVFNPVIAADDNWYTSIDELRNVTGGDSKISEKFAPFLGKSLGVQGGIFPHLSVPRFAMGFWDYFDFTILYNNPVDPELVLDGRNDYGLIAGTGIPLNQYIALGASLRFQRRKILAQTLNAGDLLNMTTDKLSEFVRNGEGFGLNVGVQSRVPFGKQWLAMGGAIEDVGNTRFKNGSYLEPAAQAQSWNLGLGYGFNTTLLDFALLVDGRQLQYNEMSYTKKIFLGTELNFAKMDFRGGFYHGYWTAGITARLLPLFDIDLTTYGEELGSSAGVNGHRIWMIGLRTGVGATAKGGGKKYRSQLNAL